jgi:hypothetical protein
LANAQHTPGPWEVFAGTIVQEQNNGPTITILKEAMDDPAHEFFEIRANAQDAAVNLDLGVRIETAIAKVEGQL